MIIHNNKIWAFISYFFRAGTSTQLWGVNATQENQLDLRNIHTKTDPAFLIENGQRAALESCPLYVL